MSIIVNFEHKSETTTCYRFEARIGDDFITLYLKKKQLVAANIDPFKGLAVTIEQKRDTLV